VRHRLEMILLLAVLLASCQTWTAAMAVVLGYPMDRGTECGVRWLGARSLYDFDDALPRPQVLRRKYDALEALDEPLAIETPGSPLQR